MNLIDGIKRNSVFVGLWLVLIVALTIAICLIDKGSLHLMLCDHHTAWLDAVMPVISDTCNWLPYVVAAILLIWRWRTGLFLTGSLVLSTLFAQGLKHLVQAPRPLTWFAENMPDVTLPLTEGVQMNYYLSFPSGHTTTFFCLFFALCVIYTYYTATPSCERKVLHRVGSIAVQVLLFALATIGAYSRLYLSQHFALDVLAGMIIGVLSVIIVAAITRGIMLLRPKQVG